jgi:hypothetical protein
MIVDGEFRERDARQKLRGRTAECGEGRNAVAFGYRVVEPLQL